MSDEKPASDRPSATAVSSAFQDLEDKLINMLEAHLERQMAAIQGGQSTLLKIYQDESKRHTEWLARTLQELQEFTHQKSNAMQRHEAQLSDNDKQHELFEKRLQALERWHYDMTAKLDPGDPECPPASSSTTSR
jgi:hypothetical protein